MSKISIVVPVYNVEKYLDQCILSLINQTFKDIEIILVDDGSTDNSGKICDKYAKIDHRIKVFHKKNEGLSQTRKFGVSKAQSDYTCFLDSDDYFENNFCEVMYKMIHENDADIAECDYRRFSQDFFKKADIYETSLIYDKKDFLENIVKNTIIYGTVSVVVWNKIYKTDYIKLFVKDYGEQPIEDYLFNMQYYQAVNKYVYTNEALVNYRQVKGSLSSKSDKNFYEKLKKIQIIKEAFMSDIGMNNEECTQLSYKWFYQYVKSNFINMILAKGKCDVELQKYIINIITDDMFYGIIYNYMNDDSEILYLKNHNYSAYIRTLKMIALRKRIRFSISKIKKFIIGRKHK